MRRKVKKGEKHSGWVFGNLAQKAKNKFEPGRRNSSFVLAIQRKIAVIFLVNLVIVPFSARVEAKAEAIFSKTLPTF